MDVTKRNNFIINKLAIPTFAVRILCCPFYFENYQPLQMPICFHRAVMNNATEHFVQLKFMASKSPKSSRNISNISTQSAKANRGNIVMTAMVELGLKLMKNKSVAEVARFLAAAGVPVHVITRVLLRPDLRRNLKRQRLV